MAIPLLLAGIPALLAAISGGVDIATSVKKFKGGKLATKMHRRLMFIRRKRGGRLLKKRRVVKRGKGIAADIASAIPILGPIAGPLIRAFGGKLKKRRIIRKRGRGLAPMYLSRPYVGGMILRRKLKKRRIIRKRGRGLAPMYLSRPYVGLGMLTPPGGHNDPYTKAIAAYIQPIAPKVPTQVMVRPRPSKKIDPRFAQFFKKAGTGLLAPAGGLIHRKGHYRHLQDGTKIRIASTVVRKGRGMTRTCGGYMPYTF